MWLFFRDDDLGWSPREFARLVTLFAKHDQKLNAAAIPECATEEVIRESIPYSYQAAPFLQVVTHGYSHTNQAKEGKRAEYCAGRPYAEVQRELESGRKLLSERFENYFPCFVPPWNRFSSDYLPLLPESGYLMLSRDETPRKEEAPLPEFDVCLDLHTAKERKFASAKEIFRELARRNEEGRDFSGVMLHHARMGEEDFAVLDELLRELSKRGIASCFFSDLLPGHERRRGIELGHV